MKIFLKNLQTIVIFMVIWIILNENVTPFTLITGVLISGLTLRFTNGLLKMNYAHEFYAPPLTSFTYLLLIVKEIYLAGYDMMERILKGNIVPTFIEYESGLSNQLSLVLLSNSITLTPGTVTVDRYEQSLTILSANSNKEEVRKGTYEGIEKKLERFERR